MHTTKKEVTLLIADDSQEMRETLKTLLTFNETIKVVGEASNGEEAVEKVAEIQPDLVLMDINMPVMDGLKATEAIAIKSPHTGVIIISVQEEVEYMRRAMSAGAREYLVKPFDSDELFRTINNVIEKEMIRRNSSHESSSGFGSGGSGKIISLFSPKGGVGKSVLAVNLATEIRKMINARVLLLDLNLEFGDLALLLNLNATTTIVNVAQTGIQSIDMEYLKSNIMTTSNGIDILPAPLKPEYAEIITPGVIQRVIELVKNEWDYIIIDTACSFKSEVLSALDLSNLILMVFGGDFLSLKNSSLALSVMSSLNYPMEQVKLVLNRAFTQPSTKILDIEKGLKKRIDYQLPADLELVLNSINRGQPFVDTNPSSDLAKSIRAICEDLLQVKGDVDSKKKAGLFSLFAKKTG
ncbi:response regulator [bacterium]|nr:response regulator [bacterium]MBU1024676.1 response regulator [bacterium]